MKTFDEAVSAVLTNDDTRGWLEYSEIYDALKHIDNLGIYPSHDPIMHGILAAVWACLASGDGSSIETPVATDLHPESYQAEVLKWFAYAIALETERRAKAWIEQHRGGPLSEEESDQFTSEVIFGEQS